MRMNETDLAHYMQQLKLAGYGMTDSEVKDYLLLRALDDLLRAGIITRR